jgi:hypothetical protein
MKMFACGPFVWHACAMFASPQFAWFAPGEPLIARAYAAAVEAHLGQVRESDAAPFIRHPVEVAMLLLGCRASSELVAVGLLHDAAEKRGTSIAAIRTEFGDRIAELVATLTDDATITDFSARKAALLVQVALADLEALVVLAADKVAKARELHTAIAAGRVDRVGVGERCAHYAACLGLVERRLPGHPLAGVLALELVLLTRALRGGPIADHRRRPLGRRGEEPSKALMPAPTMSMTRSTPARSSARGASRAARTT